MLPLLTLIRFAVLLIGLIAACTTAALAAAPANGELGIRRITPAGEDVPPGNQILIEFDRAVVPLGRMERDGTELPITLTPALNCKWRWLNRQALACNLDDADRMAPATRYTVSVQPGITTMDGATLAGAVTHEFVTLRPGIANTWFQTWRHPGVPVLRVTFNQPVTRASVERRLLLAVAERPSPVRVSAAADPEDPEPPAQDGAARRIWLVEPTAGLPLDRQVMLQVDAGLISALGPEPGIARPDVIEFHTFPEFTFLGVRCTNNEGERILIAPGEAHPQMPELMCNPLAGVALAFSSPVLNSELKRALRVEPDLAGGRTDYDPWANRRDYSRLQSPHIRGTSYEIALPERLRAFQAYAMRSREPDRNFIDHVLSWFTDLPATDLRDEFGRPLRDAIALSFWTNHRLPNFQLGYRDAVLESAIDSEVPLYITNLDEVRLHYRLVSEDHAAADRSLAFSPPKVTDIAFGVPLRAREMTEGKSGAVFGTIGTFPSTAGKSEWERRFFAQVTPYQVHAKVGHFNSLVWVTDLQTGQPVANAKVSLYRDTLTKMSTIPADATVTFTDAEGIAALPGTITLDPKLTTFGWRCSADDCEKLFVRVDGPSGMALLPLNEHYRVDVARASNYDIYPNLQEQYGHIRAWGSTAQGVYRAGDKVQFKIYVRDQNNAQFVASPRASYTLELKDPTGKTVHEMKDIGLNDFGAFAGEYTVPDTSVMGWYDFELRADFTDRRWRPMRVLISDFTPAAFRVTNQLNGDLFRPGDRLVAETKAALHSGGAYTQAEARVTVNLQARWFSSKDPMASRFSFDTANTENRLQIYQEIGELTDEGTQSASVELTAGPIVYGRLAVESAVRDDRGKYIAALATADYLGIDRLVGLRKDSWIFDAGKEAEVQYLTVNERGVPVDDTPVTLQIEHLVTKAARVKGAGNAYLTNFVESWEPAGECTGKPLKNPLPCSFVPQQPGRYRVIASIEDTRGRTQSTTLWAWVAGKDQVVWREDAGYALEMIAEKEAYEVGDSARFLIRNPFPGASALVTLERYGVLKQWQTTLSGSTPILEVPIEADYVPGAYLSVVVFSPRVADPPLENRDGAGQIDLGKPAFRIGYAQIDVIDPYKQIAVTASTDREVYKPGETVNVNLTAAPVHPGAAEPIEFAAIVIDEAVFDLIAGGRDYFDPYAGFYALDGLDVDNFSLLTRIVGRQNFEKKGASSGGDGGAGLTMRSIFKYVSYWNPSLQADTRGNADFHFSLPDNLTGWRVLAMAVTPTDRFGLGDGSFKTNQPTEIRPVMPNQVTEGDRFNAGFSIMNRTPQARSLQVTITASGAVAGAAVTTTRHIKLDPYQRDTVYQPVETARLTLGRDVSRGSIRFAARAWDASDGDAVAHDIPVLKRRSFEVAANYGSITAGSVNEPILFPGDIYPDVGDVSVVLAPTIIGNAEGAFRYLRDYDYVCWEQILTKGVMASHFNALQGYLDPSLSWPESRELPQLSLQRAANYQAPNGGMTYFVPVDQNVSPYLSAYTALSFNWLRSAGYEIPGVVETHLHEYLQRLLRRDEVPTFYSQGMSSTVRAVALNALAAHGKLELPDLRRYTDQLPYMDLFGAANFMEAALQLDDAQDLVNMAMDRVMAHANATGGKLTFTEVVDDGYARILSTQLRSNCAILSAISRLPDLTGFDASTRAAAMIRAITQARGNRDHWENTQENMFCMNALIDYSRRFERVPPHMAVGAALNGKPLGKGRFDDVRDKALAFSTPITAEYPGREAQLTIEQQGEGRLYYAARVAYSRTSDNTARINAGIDIRREYSVLRGGSWQLLSSPALIARGELVRVDLFLNLPAARSFVVVDDHVPGGLEPVNRDLANSSEVDAEQGDFAAAGGSWWFEFSDWISFGASRWSFYHRELRDDAVRFYADYLPAGHYHLSYSAQAIATGRFAVRPAQAAEMYDTDVYGKTLPTLVDVQESP